MKRRNVLLVANYAPDVGYAWWLMERFWIQIAEGCAAAGAECFIAYPTMGPIPPGIAASAAIPMECDYDGGGAAGFRHLLSVIRERRIGSLYLTDKAFRKPSYGLLRAAGVERIVIHDHTPGDRDPVVGLKGAAKSVLNRIGPVNADLWVAISPLMRQRALLTTWVPPEKCFVVQNGIDLDSPGVGQRAEARQELALAPDQVGIVSVGRASRYKNLDFLVRLGAKAREAHDTGAIFFHFGDGPDLEDFRAQVTGLGLEGTVRFVGRRNDVAKLLEGCDVAFHPSQGEGFSLAILEYMRAGLPVVVPDRPSVCQAIDDGRTGRVYRQGDLESALEAVSQLVSEPEARKRMGLNAADELRRHYPWSRTRDEFTHVVAYLLGEEPRPHGALPSKG